MPVPASRAEAHETFRPRLANARARGRVLDRLNALGLVELRPLEHAGEPVTREQAHVALLDALYDPVTGLLRDMPTTPVQAQRVHETTD